MEDIIEWWYPDQFAQVTAGTDMPILTGEDMYCLSEISHWSMWGQLIIFTRISPLSEEFTRPDLPHCMRIEKEFSLRFTVREGRSRLQPAFTLPRASLIFSPLNTTI